MPPRMDRLRRKKRGQRHKKLTGAAKVQAIAQRNAEYEEEDSSSESEEWYSGCEHDPRAYQKGGYFKVEPGQKLNDRYKIQKRLGWGHFAMVYLAKDLQNDNKFVACKIQKSSLDYQEAAEEEIPFLEKARDCMDGCALPGASRVTKLIDSFTAFGPHGKHYVMVFEVLGLCSADLVEDFADGLPTLIVKLIMKDILQSLQFLHDECGIVHMDIKPENVLFEATSLPTDADIDLAQKLYRQKAERKALAFAERQMERDGDRLKKKQRKALRQKIAKLKKKVEAQEDLVKPDVVEVSEKFVASYIAAMEKQVLGTVVEEEHENESDDDGSPKPPPVAPAASLCDLGTACWKSELNKFEVGTRYGRPPEMLVGAANGPPADVWAVACLCLEYLTGEPFFDPENADDDGNSIDVDEEHLRLMCEALGEKWPKCITENPLASGYFDRKGRLKAAADTDCPGLRIMLSERLGWEDDQLEPLVNFLLPMLNRDPGKRATAAEMLGYSWLVPTAKDVEIAKDWLEEALEPSAESSDEPVDGSGGEYGSNDVSSN